MNVFELYEHLPEDVREYIKGYLSVWQRYGLKRKPKVPMASAKKYYCTIRRAPRSFRWNPSYPRVLYFRRQRDVIKWELRLDEISDATCDHLSVTMSPQWGRTPGLEDIVRKLWYDRSLLSIGLPNNAILLHRYVMYDVLAIILTFSVLRPSTTSPPTTQSSVYAFAEYIRKASSHVERLIKNWSRGIVDEIEPGGVGLQLVE